MLKIVYIIVWILFCLSDILKEKSLFYKIMFTLFIAYIAYLDIALLMVLTISVEIGLLIYKWRKNK